MMFFRKIGSNLMLLAAFFMVSGLPGIFIQSDASQIPDSTLLSSSSESKEYVPKESDAEKSTEMLGNFSCLSMEIESTLDCSSLDIERIDSPLVVKSDIKMLLFAYNKLELLQSPIIDSGNLIAIDFSNNKLIYISEHVFANLSQVRRLVLAHNGLWEFDEDVFNGLSQLETLDLSFNEFSILDPRIFKNLKNLGKLFLRNNRFAMLRDDSFEHLIKLETLDLSGNDLSDLPENIFRYNLNLRNLDISGNNLKQVPNQALGSAARLYFLNLGSNKFTRLKYPSFSKLSSVVILRLEKLSELKSIGPQTFQGMDNLKFFFSSFCPNLKYVDEKAFFDNRTEKTLDISSFIFRHNSVTTLSSKLLDWKSVKDVDLTGNPWNCDCHLDWMFSLTIREDLKNGIKCEYPNYLKGFQVSNLTFDQYKCSFLFNHEFTIVGTILLIITISMTIVVFMYIVVKVCPCTQLRNPFRRDFGYSKVKVSRNGKNYDLEWDTSVDPN